jgi:NAD(P)-dependent dehydrogenase (short-subunit alcohol dehydrogenase family)
VAQAAKAGLIMLMKVLAKELAAHRIRVNTIHPTTVATGMILNEPTLPASLRGAKTTLTASGLKLPEADGGLVGREAGRRAIAKWSSDMWGEPVLDQLPGRPERAR